MWVWTFPVETGPASRAPLGLVTEGTPRPSRTSYLRPLDGRIACDPSTSTKVTRLLPSRTDSGTLQPQGLHPPPPLKGPVKGSTRKRSDRTG